jgi:hypothetical protein
MIQICSIFVKWREIFFSDFEQLATAHFSTDFLVQRGFGNFPLYPITMSTTYAPTPFLPSAGPPKTFAYPVFSKIQILTSQPNVLTFFSHQFYSTCNDPLFKLHEYKHLKSSRFEKMSVKTRICQKNAKFTQ